MRAASLLAVCLACTGAFAAPRAPASLIYDASGTRCPDKAELVKAVTRRLGASPFGDGASEKILVQVSPVADGTLRATVTRMVDGAEAGKRELSSPAADCRDLFQAVELAVAMAMDPRGAAPAPAAVAAPESAPAVVSLAAAPEPRPSTLAFRVSTGPSDTPVTRMTRGALSAERLRLDAVRPSSGVGFIALGGGGVIAGTLLIALSAANNGNNAVGAPTWVFPVVGTVMIVAGVVSIVYGVVKRMLHSEERPVYDQRIGDIDQRMSQLDTTAAVDPGPPSPAVRPAIPAR
jgi:hypothetical protein